METKYSYIYKVTNLINGKSYIGQSISPIRRIREHISEKGLGSELLYSAIQKYGLINFSFEIIESEVLLENVDNREIYLIASLNTKYPNGYNLTDGGQGARGCKISEETRKKLRMKVMSESTRKKISDFNKGKTLSDKTKTKIGVANKGHTVSESARMAMSAANIGHKRWIGKKHRLESKEKMRTAKLGIKQSNETKIKRALALTKKITKEQIETVLSLPTEKLMYYSLNISQPTWKIKLMQLYGTSRLIEVKEIVNLDNKQ